MLNVFIQRALLRKRAEHCSRELFRRRALTEPQLSSGRRVSNAAVANAALGLSSKNWKKYSRWGASSKNKSEKAWASIFAGIDAALVRAHFLFAGAPTIENKIEQ